VAKLNKEQSDKLSQTIEEAKLAEDGSLNDFEMSFMASMEERFEKYKDDTFVSPKQWNVINNIYDKLVGCE
jgi:hypothetical protein